VQFKEGKMAYTALYRAFRPIKFADMVGQDHITKTLKNQIMAGRVGHAYLFNGGRGTGKTTSAKILARAVNCLNIQDGEPCNECEICKEILNGSLTDVVEMDAASNNSVEDIRTIRDEVNFLPTKAKYRVYIIDEVHMLSPGAFNALLKTLEEPPEHVKFILATTEPQKLPTTILSRCQRFDFKKISDEDVVKRLKIICAEANIKINDEALKIIAILSEGAMRDAISILERCGQESTEEITADMVKELVGIPKLEYINKITKSILENDEIQALSTVDDVIREGKDLYNFLWEIIKYVKDVLVYKSTGHLELYSNEELEDIKALANNSEKEKLLSIIYELSELENNIKWSNQKTIMFQTGIIKACMNSNIGSGNVQELQNRIEKLEAKINSINPPEMMQKSQNNYVPEPRQSAPIESKSKPVSNFTKPTQSDFWRKVIDNLKQSKKMMLYTTLLNSKAVQTDDLNIEIEFPNGLTAFNEKVLSDPNNKNDLMKAIFAITGNQMNIKIKDGKVKQPEPTVKKSSMPDLGIDINIIE
jgi:DNA polymerase-3 subunit gamma/tau